MKKWIIGTCIAVVFIVIAVATAAIYFYGPAMKPVTAATKTVIEGGALPPGCTCHSKDKGLTSMHARFGITDCRKCHGNSENLTSRKAQDMTPDHKAALEKRKKQEEICQQCHQ